MRKFCLTIGVAMTLGGCVTTPQVAEDGSAVAPRDTSPAALAALPAGLSPAFLIRGEDGCYGIALEQTDPPQGIPLRNALGQQVCDA